MLKLIEQLLIALYLLGWLADWAYWVVRYPPGETASIVWGFAAGIFWPLHLLVVFWQRVI